MYAQGDIITATELFELLHAPHMADNAISAMSYHNQCITIIGTDPDEAGAAGVPPVALNRHGAFKSDGPPSLPGHS